MSNWYIPPNDLSGQVINSFLPLRKINYVTKFWFNPCSAPFYVYVETALPALLELLISYNTFGTSDISRNSLGRSQVRWTRRLFSGWRRYAPYRKIGGTGFLFRADGVVQRLLWWWLVADLTVDFLYNWTSLVNRTEWCTGNGIYQAVQISGAFPCADAWSGVPINQVTQNKDNWARTAVNVLVPGGTYHAILTVDAMFNSIFNFGTDFQIRLVVTGPLWADTYESDKVQLKVGEKTPVTVTASFPASAAAGASVAWQWRYSTGGIPLIDYGQADIIVSQDSLDP